MNLLEIEVGENSYSLDFADKINNFKNTNVRFVTKIGRRTVLTIYNIKITTPYFCRVLFNFLKAF